MSLIHWSTCIDSFKINFNYFSPSNNELFRFVVIFVSDKYSLQYILHITIMLKILVVHSSIYTYIYSFINIYKIVSKYNIPHKVEW